MEMHETFRKCMRLLQVAIRMCFISKEHTSGVITREKKSEESKTPYNQPKKID